LTPWAQAWEASYRILDFPSAKPAFDAIAFDDAGPCSLPPPPLDPDAPPQNAGVVTKVSRKGRCHSESPSKLPDKKSWM